MRFSRLFGKPEEPQQPEEPEQQDAEAVADNGAADGEEYEGVPEGDSDADLDQQWRGRAADVIPGGASTTRGIALIAGTAVRIIPSTMKSSNRVAWKSGGGRMPMRVVIVGCPSIWMR